MITLEEKQQILNTCLETVEQRGDEYGDEAFERAVKILDVCFNIKLQPWMMAAVMFSWKMARMRNDVMNQKRKEDTTVDAINYLAIVDIERRKDFVKVINDGIEGTKVE